MPAVSTPTTCEQLSKNLRVLVLISPAMLFLLAALWLSPADVRCSPFSARHLSLPCLAASCLRGRLGGGYSVALRIVHAESQEGRISLFRLGEHWLSSY